MPRGISTRRKPSRPASATRCDRNGTLRMSPESATSPMAMTSPAIGRLVDAEASAMQTARSQAGSESFAPPTVATNTSRSPMRACPERSVTATSIATREASRPLTPRRGLGEDETVTSDCTSASRGRRPSIVTVTQVPGTGRSRCSRNRSEGSSTSRRPSSACSKQTISSAGP